jgi:hypothetical protein
MLLEHVVRDQVDRGTTVVEHLGDWPPIVVASNVQWLELLARLVGLLEHDLLGTKAHLSYLLLNILELGWQHEHHVDIHAGQRWRPVLDQWRPVVVQ